METRRIMQRIKRFQDSWNLDKLKKMTLEQYSNNARGYDNFIYKIIFDSELSAYIKNDNIINSETCFGICKKTNGWEYKNKKYMLDKKDGYVWQSVLGDNKKNAFEKIKSEIIKVAKYSKNNELSKIDNLDLLFFDFKWKIAFLYQSLDNMQMFNIFSESLLKKIADNELGNSMLKPSQIYLQILNKTLKDKPYEFGNVLEIGEKLRKMYAQNSNTAMQKDMQIQSDSKYQDKGEKMNDKIKTPPLNQILYGPPGTGKTYSTINKALEILGVETQDKSRAELKAKFDEFRQNGQIEFVTFHQSFSYEEFVEGIKPKLIDFNDGVESSEMSYKIKSGIFKQICEKAQENLENSQKSQEQIKQELDLQELFEAYLESVESKLNEADFDNPALKIPNSKMTIRKIYRLDNGEGRSLFVGVEGAESMQSLTKDIILRDYANFKSGVIKSYQDIKPKYESQAKYHGNAIYYFALYEKIAEFEKSYKPQNQAVSEVKLKPYILIIDEINRGNISKILGELITLIEPSKRIGADEELRVTLPYSNESFGVPSNLYIIGTMNTADRSIALLDTALRRRFEFVEMMPECGNENISTNCEGVNLQRLLKSINDRIEFLLDREHTIGHSFFINVNSLSELQQVFKNKIIPLLQEYFYDDYAKIDAVLNGNQMIKPKPKPNFLGKFNDEVDSEKVVYEIVKSQDWAVWQFVYDSKAGNSQKSSESNDNGE